MLDAPTTCPLRQAKCSTYESEAEQNKQLQAVEGTTAAQRLRDKDKRIASLEEELEGVKDQADDLDRMLRDARSKVGPIFEPAQQPRKAGFSAPLPSHRFPLRAYQVSRVKPLSHCRPAFSWRRWSWTRSKRSA